jgi:hypothetical protein
MALADLLPPARATTSGTLTLVVRMRNVGGSPWTVGKEWLATTNGKADPLRTSAWPVPTRPPAMTRNVTRPGVTTVHPGEVGEWRIPLSAVGRKAGTYTESWRGIAPGGARFGPVFTTTVTVPGTTSGVSAQAAAAPYTVVHPWLRAYR